MERRSVVLTYADRISVSSEAFHPSQPVFTLYVPHAHFSILSATSQEFPICAQRKRPDLICVAVNLLSLFPLLLPLFRCDGYLLARPQVPLDD